MTSETSASARPGHRTLGEQLNRSPRVLHASWSMGLVVLLAGATAGFSFPGVIFLVVLFSPIYVAYRRDRLSFGIMFACFFLPAWPWAAYKAFSRRQPRRTAAPVPDASPTP